MRVPLHLETAVQALIRRDSRQTSGEHVPRLGVAPVHRLPIADISVPAGAFDYHDDSAALDSVDLTEWLTHDPAQSYLYTVTGDSMNRAGIHDRDRLVVDRSVSPRSGHIVVAWVAGEGLTVKRLKVQAGRVTLEPDSDNSLHRAYTVERDDELTILGVVCGITRRLL